MYKNYDPLYYQQHKERIGKNNKRWQEENREYMLGYARKWRAEHLDICHQYGRATRQKLKFAVLGYYSFGEQPKCVHCGIDDIDVLCIDHLLNNGKEERQNSGQGGGHKFYRWLKQNGYPSGYQVLCANCNLKKEQERQRNGYRNP